MTIKAFVPIWKSSVTLTRLILKWLIARLKLQTPKDDQQEQPHVLLEMGSRHAFKCQTLIWIKLYELLTYVTNFDLALNLIRSVDHFNSQRGECCVICANLTFIINS